MPSSSLIKFLDLTTDDPKLRPILDRLKEVIRVLSNKQLIDGQLLEQIPVQKYAPTNYVNIIPHKLGRRINGYMVVKEFPSTNISEDRLSDENFLYIISSLDSTISLWVF